MNNIIDQLDDNDVTIEELYPPDRLERMRVDSSRDEMTGFITVYHRCLELGGDVPDYWHRFAADIMYRAANADSGDLAKVMGLNGRASNIGRNDVVCISVQQRVNLGESETSALKAVCKHLSINPDSMRRKVWNKRDKQATEQAAKEMPDFDFLDHTILNI